MLNVIENVWRQHNKRLIESLYHTIIIITITITYTQMFNQ